MFRLGRACRAMRARSSPIPCSARVRRRKCRVGASPDLRAANKACFREVVENRESGAGGDAHGCGDVGDARVRHARHRQEHVPVVGEQGPRRTRGHGGHGVAATGVRRHTGSGSVSFVSVARWKGGSPVRGSPGGPGPGTPSRGDSPCWWRERMRNSPSGPPPWPPG